MKHSRIKYIIMCFSISCLIVVALQLSSSWKESRSNGFTRLFPSHKIKGVNSYKLDEGSFYIAGGDSSEVLLGDWSKPGRIFKKKFDPYESLSIALTGYEKAGFYQGTYLRSLNNNIYLIDENKPLIGSGVLATRVVNKFYSAPYFTANSPLSSESFVLRVVKGMHNYLAKYRKDTISGLFKLEKQGDGIFSTDGILLTAEDANKIFYIFHYRNQFLALDTNLLLLYEGKTRDTISHSEIKISRNSSGNKISLSTPPLIVNKQCSANDQWLFIHSGLKADNETKSASKSGSVIDVYAVADGKYQFSFYLPDFGGEKNRDFKVCGQSLYTLYDHYLYKYKLNF